MVSPASKVPSQQRHCLRGNHNAPATKFMSNAGWVANAGRDVWCKDCVAKLTTREDALRYCWENHREWSEDAWSKAMQRARESLSKDKTYVKVNSDRQRALEERFAMQFFPNYISRKPYYKYFDPGDETFEHAIRSGRFDQHVENEEAPRSRVKVYSKRFSGSFTEDELAYLEEFYDNLGGDEIDDYIDREYIKKLAKASLAANKAQEDYNACHCTCYVVRDTMDIFDMRDKSSSLTAFQKKAKTTAVKTSWSQWSRDLAQKEIYAPKITWPKDDIDKTLEEFQHIISAVQGGVPS